MKRRIRLTLCCLLCLMTMAVSLDNTYTEAGTKTTETATTEEETMETTEEVKLKNLTIIRTKTNKKLTTNDKILKSGKKLSLAVKGKQDGTIKWKSGNKKVATVSATGMVKAKSVKKTKTVVITANLVKNKKITGTASFVLTVIPEGHTHEWDKRYKTVHHDAVYDYEEVLTDREMMVRYDACGFVQVTSFDVYSADAWCIHQVHGSMRDGTYFDRSDEVSEYCNQYATGSEYISFKTEKQILISDAYDEQVECGYKCSVCGKIK